MNPRSIDEVWRQMQAQRQIQEQKRIEQERKIWEQRERQRQEYVLALKMNERLAPSIPTSAASSAGGTRPSTNTPDYPILFAETHMITWADIDSDTWKFVVYNFNTGTLSQVYDTELIYDSGNEWYLYDEWRAVAEKGHSIVFRKDGTNLYKIFFFNVNGDLVGQKNLESFKDFQYTENAQIYVGDLDGTGTVYHFTGDNVRTHTFDGLSASQIEVDDTSEDDVMQDGSIIIEAPNNTKRFIARPDGDLVEITSFIENLDSFRIDYNTDFVFAFDQELWVKAVSQEGELKNTFDTSTYNITGWDDASLYGDNCAFVVLSSDDGYRLLITYDGDSNNFVSLTFSNSLIYELVYHNKSWQSPRPYSSSNFILELYVDRSYGTIGWETSGLEVKWLTKGSTEFLSQSFVGSTISYIDGGGAWTSDRIFALGENPIVMFAYTQSFIQTGFLLSSGFFTQSTGIQYASCSNIWGKPIDDQSFAVFDVGSDRIWQIYDENSIVTETNTGGSWNWGSSNNDVNRNGTLAVLDTGVPSNTFVYTTQIGLTAGPSDADALFNNISWGSRTSRSSEYQIFVKYIDGQEVNSYVLGFYLLSKSGLSTFEEFPFIGLSPSSYYTISDINIGTQIASFNLTDSSTSNLRCLVYDLSNLNLIDDYDSEQSTNVYVSDWNNRVCVVKQNGNERQVRFVGSQGVETKIVEANSFSDESNDPRDNDD